MIDVVAIKARYDTLAPHLDERARRLFAASEARAVGFPVTGPTVPSSCWQRSTSLGTGSPERRAHDFLAAACVDSPCAHALDNA